jgi:hypothetical protein
VRRLRQCCDRVPVRPARSPECRRTAGAARPARRCPRGRPARRAVGSRRPVHQVSDGPVHRVPVERHVARPTLRPQVRGDGSAWSRSPAPVGLPIPCTNRDRALAAAVPMSGSVRHGTCQSRTLHRDDRAQGGLHRRVLNARWRTSRPRTFPRRAMIMAWSRRGIARPPCRSARLRRHRTRPGRTRPKFRWIRRQVAERPPRPRHHREEAAWGVTTPSRSPGPVRGRDGSSPKPTS